MTQRERKHISFTDFKFKMPEGLTDKLIYTQYVGFKQLSRLLGLVFSFFLLIKFRVSFKAYL